MTEKEWLVSTDSLAMLEVAVLDDYDLNGRKRILFDCACGRRIWYRLPEAHRKWIIVAEQVADGLANEEMLEQAQDAAEQSEHVVSIGSILRPEMARYRHNSRFAFMTHRLRGVAELAIHANLLREIHGNPFHPITIDPRWLTSSVVEIANTIYNDQVFDKMPILADALMDAGCDHQEVINHCRSEDAHVRGCWVVDLLLGKS